MVINNNVEGCLLQVACSSSGAKFNGVIPTEAIEKRYTLSSGPGGQNVQKNATKVNSVVCSLG